MQRLLAILVILICFGCYSTSKNMNFREKYKTAFDSILNTYELSGSILVYDPQQQIYHSNDFEWAQKGFLPASTFKIPNTIIAIETGVIKGDTSIIKWDGKKRDFANWEKDLNLRDAFQLSCVPCFQGIAKNIGIDRMKSYLNKLQYTAMDIAPANIDHFWLRGNSRISCFEQIDFLERFFTKKLPILNTTRTSMLQVFKIEENNHHTLSGKTGWSYNEADNNGWFVGFLEIERSVYYFALNVVPNDANKMDKFAEGRKQAVYDALKIMNLL